METFVLINIPSNDIKIMTFKRWNNLNSLAAGWTGGKSCGWNMTHGGILYNFSWKVYKKC